MTDAQRYITCWRTSPQQIEHQGYGSILDWQHYVSENITDAHRVVASITEQGVHQFSTYELGAKLATLSSDY